MRREPNDMLSLRQSIKKVFDAIIPYVAGLEMIFIDDNDRPMFRNTAVNEYLTANMDLQLVGNTNTYEIYLSVPGDTDYVAIFTLQRFSTTQSDDELNELAHNAFVYYMSKHGTVYGGV